MNKKKLLLLITSLTLVAVVGVGATLAYFTDSDDATNVITMGHVDVELEEPNFDNEDGEDDNKIDDVTPGQEIVKDPTITVVKGSADAYIRATLEITKLTDEQAAELLDNINIDTEAWYYNAEDGYYYYNKKLAAEESAVLFDKVVIPETWGNEVADMTFEIIVSAEAIQADNFEPTVDEATGMITEWTYSNGDPITAETYEVKAEATPVESAENTENAE